MRHPTRVVALNATCDIEGPFNGRFVFFLRMHFEAFPVAMSEGSHPFPSRTRKLSPPEPMVLHGKPCGRVGRRRAYFERSPLESFIGFEGAFRFCGQRSAPRIRHPRRARR